MILVKLKFNYRQKHKRKHRKNSNTQNIQFQLGKDAQNVASKNDLKPQTRLDVQMGE